MDIPQIGIVVQNYPDDENRKFIGLQILTEASVYQVFLCDAADYVNAAKLVHEKIMEAGRQANKPQRRLIEVKGTLNGSGHL